jgi:hypothetical protein
MVQYKPITIEITHFNELIASADEISTTNSDLLNSAVVRRDIHRDIVRVHFSKSLLAN